MISFEERDDKGKEYQVDKPAVYVKDLSKYVLDLLDEYAQAKKLIWKDKTEYEVWLKIGGDHGQGSFKVCIQSANTHHPNSKHNTICVGVFKAKDYYPNTVKISKLFQDGISRLRNMHWRNKRIRLFLFGDYAYLTSMYGLSGANAIHCCLFCVIKKDEINVPWSEREDAPQRTLGRIKRNYEQFSQEGEGKRVNARNYNNVIHCPLWHVLIKNVCPPYLHIMLGIIKKHHELLEEACHLLDEAIAHKMAKDGVCGTTNSDFDKHVAELTEGLKLRERMTKKTNKLESVKKGPMNRQTRAERNKLMKSIKHLSEDIEKKQNHELKIQSGHVSSCLEPVLNKHNIVFQAYHSRSFIGNHCRKYMQEQVITDLGDNIVVKVESLVLDENIRVDARTMRSNFIELNNKYRDVHDRIAHARHIPHDEANDHQASVNQYMQTFRAISPKILPKQHLLEDHACQWITSWQFGLGLHGEQGGEAIHREFRIIERLMISQPNSLKRLQYERLSAIALLRSCQCILSIVEKK